MDANDRTEMARLMREVLNGLYAMRRQLVTPADGPSQPRRTRRLSQASLAAVDVRLWAGDVADGLENVEAVPRGALLGHRGDHVADGHRLLDLRLVDRRCVDAVGEGLRGHADGGGLGQPS
jgi:hypothetical protein